MKISHCLTDNNREKIKELANYIAQPPIPIIFTGFILQERIRWRAIGMRIWTALSNVPHPSERFQRYTLSPTLTKQIEADSSYYIALAALTFQAEGFIKAEAERQGVEFPFQNTLQLVYSMIAEEAIDRLQSRSPHNNWESPSGSQFKEMIRDTKKWLNGEISDNLILKKVNKWKKEDRKNLNGQIFIQKIARINGARWDSFCEKVFFEYQKNLPSFEDYKDTMILRLYSRILFAAKFAFIDGQVRLYPGRGKSKG